MNANYRGNSIYCYKNALEIVNMIYGDNNDYEIDCLKILADLYYPIDQNESFNYLKKCKESIKLLYGENNSDIKYIDGLLKKFKYNAKKPNKLINIS